MPFQVLFQCRDMIAAITWGNRMATRIQRKKDGSPDLRFGANRTKRNTTARASSKTNKRTTMRGGARGR